MASARTAGVGHFIRALRRGLARPGLDIPFVEHDLAAELRGRPCPRRYGGNSEPSVSAVAFSPGSTLLAIAHGDGNVRLWDVPLIVDPHASLYAAPGAVGRAET